MPIIHFVNSFVNRPGNIGMRTGRILKELSKNNKKPICICRGVYSVSKGVHYSSMGFFGHIPRILNAIRIYLFPLFDHRILDIALFQWFAIYKLTSKNYDIKSGLCHVWDMCPKLIDHLHRNGHTVVLDVPIVPYSYVNRINNKGLLNDVVISYKMMKIEQQAFEKSDVLIAPSSFVAKQLITSGILEEKIRIIPFGVDLQLNVADYPPLTKKYELDFCFLGNVNLRKGIKELMAAWSFSRFTNDRLHLCGRIYPESKSFISSANGGEIVTPGFIEPFSYLKQCDVFVFPSWMEGSAKAVYEAMACGLPVIVTESSGSIIQDGVDGFVIQAGDYLALRQKMIWLKENPDRRHEMGLAALKKAGQYSWEKYSASVINVYNAINKELPINRRSISDKTTK